VKATEIILVMLEVIAGWFGFGLVPVEDVEILAGLPIPYRVEEGGRT
jgi:hypothetical protein